MLVRPAIPVEVEGFLRSNLGFERPGVRERGAGPTLTFAKSAAKRGGAFSPLPT